MSTANIEQQISQYAAGTLAQPARANLESCLHEDPQLRELLNEYRQLDQSLAALPDMPSVRWDMLADRLSASVASATMLTSDDASLGDAEVLGRIDSAVARTAWMRSGLAAGVLLTLCSGALLWHQHQSVAAPAAVSPNSVIATNEVTGPRIDPTAEPVIVQIHVGSVPMVNVSRPQTAVLPVPHSVVAGDLKPNPAPASKIH